MYMKWQNEFLKKKKKKWQDDVAKNGDMDT